MVLLIVEDNAEMRRMIRSLTADLADQTFECEDGAQALNAYRTLLPDWVTMDIRMKEMDGLAATRFIRAFFPEANILIVTDYNDAEICEEARHAGARALIHKENLLQMRQYLGAH